MEKYSTFPMGTKQSDVFDMLLDGSIECICYNCSTQNTITEEMSEEFACTKCKHTQLIASMNPKYLGINNELLEK